MTTPAPQDHTDDMVEWLEVCASQSERGLNFAGTPQKCRQAAAEITTLRTQLAEQASALAKAREALGYISQEHDAGRHGGKPEPCPSHSKHQMWRAATAALKQIEATANPEEREG